MARIVARRLFRGAVERKVLTVVLGDEGRTSVTCERDVRVEFETWNSFAGLVDAVRVITRTSNRNGLDHINMLELLDVVRLGVIYDEG
ncbi:MAG: hypothetical protein HKL86_07710 [Acidimicrobiaceae bacterium]|nr:hypothetical protein [Acidimicrobiaceae bacterium]